MSYKIDIFDVKWKKLKDLSLDKDIFSDENINEWLIHEFIVMQLANQRLNIAHTKTRGEVQRSGRKLYRQKWTWRARVGDAWSPIRRKGWVAFWPRNDRNFSKNMPKAMRRKALLWSLSLKAKHNEILWLDKFPFKEIKTKNAYDTLVNLKLNDWKTLVVVSKKEDVITKSFKNIPNVKYITANYLNPYDLLTHKKVLFFEDALDTLKEVFVK